MAKICLWCENLSIKDIAVEYCNNIQKVKSSVNSISQFATTIHTAVGTHMPYQVWDQLVLPVGGGGDIPVFTLAKLVLGLATPEECKVELTYRDGIPAGRQSLSPLTVLSIRFLFRYF